MKIAIVSDFHLGYEKFFEDAYNQAYEALKEARQEADMIIVPGDIFDNRSPKPEVLAQGINIFRSIGNWKWEAKITSYIGERKIYTTIPIIAIPGTHERRSEKSENAVELLSLAGLLANVSEACAIVEKNGEKVAVYGIGGISEERFGETLKKLDPKPVEGAFNIFVFHQSVYELMPFSKDFIKFEELPKGFDLYIDGHIHNKVEGKVHGKPFLIPGSTVLTQLKESELEKKGFFVFDTEKLSYSFHEINSRGFHLIKVDVTGRTPNEIIEEADKKINNTLEQYKESVPIIRVVLSGNAPESFRQNDFDIRALIKKYENKVLLDISKDIDDSGVKLEIDGLRSGSIENLSIKDYGLSIFLEKLASKGYNLRVKSSELFDILSSEKNKEKVIDKAMEELFSKK
ncbi:MAG: DNA repair exonuclease [Candidatus Micrarchaeia archaeon]